MARVVCRLVAIAVLLVATRGETLAGDLQLRVAAASVPVRAGPGGSYREIGRVAEGEVFTALDWTADHSWWRIELARGVTGWVFGELVWPFRVVADSAMERAGSWLDRKLLGKSSIERNRFSMAVSAGALGSDGLFTLGLGIFPTDHTLLEVTVGQSAGSYGNVFSARLEVLVLLGPWRAVVPFLAAGGGLAVFSPHRNVEVFARGSNALAGAGGGLLLQLRVGLTLRVEARHMMLFSANKTWSAEAISGGVMLVF